MKTGPKVAVSAKICNRALQAAKGVEHAEMIEQLGQGKITRDQAAAHLREYSEPN